MIRRALVTGASSGIGRAIVLRLAALDVAVVAVGRRQGALDEVAAEFPDRIEPLAADVTNPDVWDKITDALIARGSDAYPIFVNCAGIAEFGPFHEQSFDSIRAHISTNLYSPMILTRQLLGPMVERGGGQIVNVLSVAATQTFAGAAAYCASKAGALAFARCIAAEYRRRGIRVTNVVPGATDTPLWPEGEGTPARDRMLSADAVAQCVVQAIMSGRDRNFDEIHVLPPDGIL